MTARQTVPLDPWGACLYCGCDPDSALCCGGNDPARYALDAEYASAPLIVLRPLAPGEFVGASAYYDRRRRVRNNTIGGGSR